MNATGLQDAGSKQRCGPAFAMAARMSPPMSACEELEGMP